MGSDTAPVGAKSKVATGTKKEVKKPTRYFGFVDGAKTIDLNAATLKIKQEELFIPSNKTSEDVVLEIWEMKGSKAEKEDRLLLKIEGKIEKQSNYNIIVHSVKQDAKQYPRRENGNGVHLYLPAQLEVLGRDGKKRNAGGAGETVENPNKGIELRQAPKLPKTEKEYEFVLPPMEYDETLELQLRCSLPGSATVGPIKVTWSTWNLMVRGSFNPHFVHPSDKNHVEYNGDARSPDYSPGSSWTKGVDYERTKANAPDQGSQLTAGGNLELVVIHSMSAMNRPEAKDDISKAFDSGLCLKIFQESVSPGRLSAHFIIEREGKVIQCVDINRQAMHAYSPLNKNFKTANQLSIGIELIGFPDQFRKAIEKKYKDEAGERAKMRDELASLDSDRRSLGAGRDKEDQRIWARMLELNHKINSIKVSAWAKSYEEFTKKVDKGGVPSAFNYTKEQYVALGRLLEVVAKRYGYRYVCSHHYIIPSTPPGSGKDPKTDPGIHFDWKEVTHFLLPGDLAGEESGNGGLYTVKT